MAAFSSSSFSTAAFSTGAFDFGATPSPDVRGVPTWPLRDESEEQHRKRVHAEHIRLGIIDHDPQPGPGRDVAGKPLTEAEIDRLAGGPELRKLERQARQEATLLEEERRLAAAARARDEEIARLIHLKIAAEERDIAFVMIALAAVK